MKLFTCRTTKPSRDILPPIQSINKSPNITTHISNTKDFENTKNLENTKDFENMKNLENKKTKKIIVKNSDDSEDEDFDKIFPNGWTKRKARNLKRWKDELEYNWIINIFLVYDLKDTESMLNWIIILISTISSSLSVVQFGDSYYSWLELYLKSGLSVSTILTTLIAAWLKKNNYVERINELDKYLHKTMKLYYELESISLINVEERMLYAIFEEKYNGTIISLFADAPSYSPYKYKKILYNVTKYYPELVAKKSPWYTNNTHDFKPFGDIITRTYKSLKYSTF